MPSKIAQPSGGDPPPPEPEISAVMARIRELAEGVDSIVGPHEESGVVEAQTALGERAVKEALLTRTVIGQAMGLLMRDLGITGDAAFAHLVKLSSHSNVKVRDVALTMVAEAEAELSRRRPAGRPGPPPVWTAKT